MAVCGVTVTHVPAEVFLQSFRESIDRKSDPAILAIGRFSSAPTLNDLRDLLLDTRDIEDLRQCVAGDCKLKLSATMIERFQKEINWTAPDYRFQVTQLFKQILLDYVQEYVRQGEDALITYDDQAEPVQLRDETHSLIAAESLAQTAFGNPTPQSNSKSALSLVEEAIVWSKIKFGLKPVTAINHLMIYKQDQKAGPQVLIISKQIYANHYFDASLAVTAFGSIPGQESRSYLFYENRSRIDGLTGLFGKLKREVIEHQAIDNLQTILEKSQTSLNARMNIQQDVSNRRSSSKEWTVAVLKACLWTFLISAFVMLLVLGKYQLKNLPLPSRTGPGS